MIPEFANIPSASFVCIYGLMRYRVIARLGAGICISFSMQQTRKERELLGDSSDDDDRGIKNPKWNAFKAVMKLLSGTAAVCVLAHPLVDAVNNFSSATKVPTFFVSFVVLPFASCSEGVSALIFIRNKKHKTASLTFSQVRFPLLFYKSQIEKRKPHRENR